MAAIESFTRSGTLNRSNTWGALLLVRIREDRCAETEGKWVVRQGWLSENRSEAGQDKMAIRYIYIFRRDWILGV